MLHDTNLDDNQQQRLPSLEKLAAGTLHFKTEPDEKFDDVLKLMHPDSFFENSIELKETDCDGLTDTGLITLINPATELHTTSNNNNNNNNTTATTTHTTTNTAQQSNTQHHHHQQQQQEEQQQRYLKDLMNGSFDADDNGGGTIVNNDANLHPASQNNSNLKFSIFNCNTLSNSADLHNNTANTSSSQLLTLGDEILRLKYDTSQHQHQTDQHYHECFSALSPCTSASCKNNTSCNITSNSNSNGNGNNNSHNHNSQQQQMTGGGSGGGDNDSTQMFSTPPQQTITMNIAIHNGIGHCGKTDESTTFQLDDNIANNTSNNVMGPIVTIPSCTSGDDCCMINPHSSHHHHHHHHHHQSSHSPHMGFCGAFGGATDHNCDTISLEPIITAANTIQSDLNYTTFEPNRSLFDFTNDDLSPSQSISSHLEFNYQFNNI